MLIRRSSPVRNFTVLPNEFLQDERLTWATRGLLAEILSRPDGWTASADSLSARAHMLRPDSGNGEGRRAVRAMFAEGKRYGYIVAQRERIPDGEARGGTWRTVLTFYDTPQASTETGTSVPPAETDVFPARTDVPVSDVPHHGTSIQRTEKKELKNHASAVAESSDDAVASSSAHAVACAREIAESAARIPAQRQAAAERKANDPRSQRVTYYMTSGTPSDVSKRLYDAIDGMTDAAVMAQWAEFRRMRPSVSKDCLRDAVDQLAKDKGTPAEATIVNLALKYGVLHYEGRWPRFVVPESMRPATATSEPPAWAA